MKRTNYQIFILAIAGVILVLLGSCRKQQSSTSSKSGAFSFAFLTDIHLQPELNAVQGFQQAIDTLNKLHPDFVLTGGDLIMDALGQTYSRADSLYNLYQETAKQINVPAYNTLGNHEIYGIYRKSGADPLNPEYGEKMFEKRIGKSYYTFDHKGWRFMVINSVEDTKKGGYIGMIDSAQVEWIKGVLAQTDPKMPIVLSTHIPFITAYTQKYGGSTLPNDSSLVVINAKNVIDLFNGYNLKLVLQGHLHTVEDVFIDGVHFVTGGAISGKWWKGANVGYEEGFVLVTIDGDQFNWKYIDYGWKVDENDR